MISPIEASDAILASTGEAKRVSVGVTVHADEKASQRGKLIDAATSSAESAISDKIAEETKDEPKKKGRKK